MKRVYLTCLLTCLFFVALAISVKTYFEHESRSIKVGFIYVGDQMTPYTENFMISQEFVAEKYGDRIECVAKYNVAEDKCEEPIQELINEGCNYIIATSYGYSTMVKDFAKANPDVEFCVPTGDNANTDPVLKNYHNCMGTIYQGRYICGVVAGMKLREMIDQGIISPNQAIVGYVAAFPYAEVISGYTAFYLGVQSVVPEARMYVKYTNTWSSYSLEKKVAEELIGMNCVIISQHSDTTGPAIACENAGKSVPVYHVGYNQSMIEFAPTRSLISCTIDYTKYFDQSIGALIAGKTIEEAVDARIYGQDSFAGIDRDWVRILELNNVIAAEGTEQAIETLKENFMDDTYVVFKGNFTGTDPFDPTDKIDLSEGYVENKQASAPGFHYVLDDVITVIP